MWNFFYNIYGGGPALPINSIHTQVPSHTTPAPMKFSSHPGKARAISLSQAQSNANPANLDEISNVTRQMSTSSTSSATSMQCDSSSPPFKLNNSISDSNLNRNIKKLTVDTHNFHRTTPINSSNHSSNINSGLILKVPNI